MWRITHKLAGIKTKHVTIAEPHTQPKSCSYDKIFQINISSSTVNLHCNYLFSNLIRNLARYFHIKFDSYDEDYLKGQWLGLLSITISIIFQRLCIRARIIGLKASWCSLFFLQWKWSSLQDGNDGEDESDSSIITVLGSRDVKNFLQDYATFFASSTISSEKVSIELQRVLKAV